MYDSSMSDDCPKNDDVMHAESWEQRYVEGSTGWDLGGPPPALVDLLASLGGGPRRVLVPGCGNGHDAVAWAKAGHAVVAVDYAPSAVLGTQGNAEAAGVEVDVRQADLFALPEEFDTNAFLFNVLHMVADNHDATDAQQSGGDGAYEEHCPDQCGADRHEE